MTIEEAFFAHLSADSGVAAVLGLRVYPTMAPQEVVDTWIKAERAYAIATYQVEARAEEQTHSGGLGIGSTDFAMNVLHGTYKGARDAAVAIKAMVKGSATLWGGLRVNRVAVAPSGTIDWNNDLLAFVASVAFEVQHEKET